MSVFCPYRNVNRPINYVRKVEVYGIHYSVFAVFCPEKYYWCFLFGSQNKLHSSIPARN